MSLRFQKTKNPILKIIFGIFLFPYLVACSFKQAFFIIFSNSYNSFNHMANKNKNGTYKTSYQKHLKFKKKTRLFSVSSVVIVVLSVLAVNITTTAFFGPTTKTVLAESVGIPCSGTAGSPTAVDESALAGDDVTFTDDGGDGYCILDAAISAASVDIEAGVVITHAASDKTGIDITTTGNFILTGDIDVDGKGCVGGPTSDPYDGFAPNGSGDCTSAEDGSGMGQGAYPGTASGGGAGHGGTGGIGSAAGSTGGGNYGSSLIPALLGAGGGAGMNGSGADYVGGAGGGFVSLNVTGTLTVTGAVTADGANGNGGSLTSSGGGSGGSVYVSASTLAGAGVIGADGGDGGNGTQRDSGGGGGGRVAVYYDTLSGFNLDNIVAAKGLKGGPDSAPTDGVNGTTFIVDNTTDEVNVNSGLDFISGGDYARGSYTIDSGANLYCGSGMGTLTISTTGNFADSGSTWSCAESISTKVDMDITGTLSTTGITWDFADVPLVELTADTWTMASGTNALTIDLAGSEFDTTITNDVTFTNFTYTGGLPVTDGAATDGVWDWDDAIDVVLTNSDINSSVDWDGLTSLNINSDSSISANELGCAGGPISGNYDGYAPNGSGVCTEGVDGAGFGIGAYPGTAAGGGAGHGGAGGNPSYGGTGGTTYGSNTLPIFYGAGGGAGMNGSGADYVGGKGAGKVYLDITGTLTVAGAISANGANGLAVATASGAGSGGSVYISTGTLAGAGSVNANGGDGGNGSQRDGGGGGGGRIAIYYATDSSSFLSGMTAANTAIKGSGPDSADDGVDGTLYTAQYNAPNKPTTTAPVGADKLRNPLATSSAYSGDATHVSSDWQISDDDTFSDSDCSDTNIVWCKLDDSSNLASMNVNNTNGTFANALDTKTLLAPSATYYMRVRHTNGVGDSTWSDSVLFTTIANNAPDQPTNTAPTNGATGQSKTPTLSSSAFNDTDNDTHLDSIWNLYESSDCSGNLQWSSEDDATNKVSISVAEPPGTFADNHNGQTVLKAHTQFSWQISHSDSYNDSTISSCTNFTTTNTAPNLDSSISTQSLTEDTDVVGAFDLDTYYSDVDWNDDDGYTCTATDDLSTALGTMTINANRTVDFTLTENANGTDTIAFSCEDGGSLSTASGSIDVNVAAQNDTPTLDSNIPTQSLTEDTDVTGAFDLDTYFSDVDTGDTCTYTTTNDFSMGTMTINGDGTVDFALTENANGTDTIQFRCTDTGTATADSNEVTVTIATANDTPTANAGVDQTIPEDDGETDLDGSASSDIDTGDTLTYAWTESADTADACSLTNQNTSVPTISVEDKESNYDCTYQLIVNDGTIDSAADTITIYITADNDAPTVTLPYASVTVDEGSEVSFSMTGSDDDTTTLTLAAPTNPTNGTFTDNGDNTGDFSWLTDSEDAGEYTVTLSANDGTNTVTSDIDITVTDVPVDEEDEEDEEVDLDNIGRIQGAKKGKGAVTIYDVDDQEMCSINAFSKGGAIGKAIKLQGKAYISVVKNKSGSTVHLYEPVYADECPLVDKKKLSPKLHPRRMATANFIGKASSQEVAVSARRGGGVHVKIYRYTVSSDKWKLVAYKRFKKVPTRYILSATTKNNIQIKRKTDGKVLYTWKLNE